MGMVQAVAWLVALLGTAAAPGVPRKEQAPSRLEAVLKGWDSARQAARQSHYKFTHTVTRYEPIEDKRTKEVWNGEVFLQRPDRLRVETKNEKGRPELVAVLTGGRARVYLFDRKQEQVLSLPDHYRFPDAAERCIDRQK